jgi:hypothetical protein
VLVAVRNFGVVFKKVSVCRGDIEKTVDEERELEREIWRVFIQCGNSIS